MKVLGLLGHPLSHSFSEKYFKEKFQKLQLNNYDYRNFDIVDISNLRDEFRTIPNLIGLNVTIPYKQEILGHLDEIDANAMEIGAANTIHIIGNRWIGYNTDYLGFKDSLIPIISSKKISKALILGSGGSSKSVSAVLKNLSIDFKIVSRKKTDPYLTYEEVNNEDLLSHHNLIINTTPLGMHPNIESYPDINYQLITPQHVLYDLVYNPEETAFLKLGQKRGAFTKNGLEMLYIQAERSWEIWTK